MHDSSPLYQSPKGPQLGWPCRPCLRSGGPPRGQDGADACPKQPVESLFLSLLTALLGYGLGRGVPRLAQRAGGLIRRQPASQLPLALLLLTPWALALVGLLSAITSPWLLLPLLSYAGGMLWGRRQIGL